LDGTYSAYVNYSTYLSLGNRPFVKIIATCLQENTSGYN